MYKVLKTVNIQAWVAEWATTWSLALRCDASDLDRRVTRAWIYGGGRDGILVWLPNERGRSHRYSSPQGIMTFFSAFSLELKEIILLRSFLAYLAI